MSRIAARLAARAWVRAAAVVLGVAFLALVIFLSQTLHLSLPVIGRPAAVVPPVSRPMQSLYQVEAQAARGGWSPELARQAGDLWQAAGDLNRAVAYWEAAAPDEPVLRERAQAYVTLGRWADAADTLDHLLRILPDGSPYRAWAQFQSGLIRAAYDPAGALDHLRASQPDYDAQAIPLIAVLESTSDPVRIGIALANAQLWQYAELAFAQSADPVGLAYGGLARDMQGKDGGVWFEQAVAFAPENAQVQFLRGLHLRLAFDYDASLQAIIAAVALDPENPALYAELGKAYQLTGDLTSAEHWLKFAVSLDDHFQPLLDTFYDDEKSLLENLGLVDEAALPFDAASTPEP